MTLQHIDKTERLSRVVVHHGIAYFSGLTAENKQDDTRGQTAQILAKADLYLERIGSNRASIISAMIWLRDIGDFDQMNLAWVDWIDKSAPPARATVEAKLGLPEILVEIQFTVAIPD
jgi:enamine deaminase RidA (YjgF/YER057c/UK114 family)